MTLEERLHALEKSAMTGDRLAVIAVIDVARKLRAAAKKLLDARYRDGECDAVALSTFDGEVATALEGATPEDE